MRTPHRLPPAVVGLLAVAAAGAIASACTALAGLDEYAVGGGAGGGPTTGTTHGGPGCVPTTCEAMGASCGTVPDGCNGTLVCPTPCTAPETCGGAGKPNQCGCTKTDCASHGKDCGAIADGCGGTVTCGASCPDGQICGANGHPNVCGIGACQPKTCAQQGVQCGPAPLGNGCDGPLDCGPCSGGLTCSSGTCACPDGWTTSFAGKALGGRLVVSANGIFTIGSDRATHQAYAARLDACAGAIAAERAFLPTASGTTATTASLSDVLLPAGSPNLVAVGAVATAADPGNGLYVELDATTLAPVLASFIFGSSGIDSLAAIALAPDGNLWMTGAATDQNAALVFWLVKSGPHAAAPCGTSGPPNALPGADIAAVSGAAQPIVAVAPYAGAQAVLVSYQQASCAPPGACAACAADGVHPWVVDANKTPGTVAIFRMVVVGSKAYAAGAFCPADAPKDCFAFVRAIDASTGALLPEQFTYDLGGTAEGFLGIVADGDALYVTGTQGLDLDESAKGKWTSGKGTVVRLRRGDLGADWIAVVPEFNVGTAIASAGPDALIVAGQSDTGSVVHRCAKSLCQ
jgi:hypothetical protein